MTTKHINRLFIWMLLGLCFFASHQVKAGGIQFNNRISGTQIAAATYVEVQDDIFPVPMNNSAWADGYVIRKAQSQVELGIERNSLATLNQKIVAQVKVRFQGWDGNFNQVAYVEDLEVTYDPRNDRLEKIRDLRVRENVHYAIVQVLDVKIRDENGVQLSIPVPDFLYLENRLDVERIRMNDGLF
ncbi:MAG: hypothetical protein AAF570_17205, partial [Bacteroidota bacterium]